MRQRLESEVALADNLALRGACLDGVAAALHHPLEEVPARVWQKLEEALVHCSDGDLAPRRGRFAVRRADGDRNGDLAADLIRRPPRTHLHAELVGPPADTDLCNAELKRRAA